MCPKFRIRHRKSFNINNVLVLWFWNKNFVNCIETVFIEVKKRMHSIRVANGYTVTISCSTSVLPIVDVSLIQYSIFHRIGQWKSGTGITRIVSIFTFIHENYLSQKCFENLFFRLRPYFSQTPLLQLPFIYLYLFFVILFFSVFFSLFSIFPFAMSYVYSIEKIRFYPLFLLVFIVCV